MENDDTPLIEWPSKAIQRVILTDFGTWINQDRGDAPIKVGVYALAGKKYTQLTDKQIVDAIDRYMLEQSSGVRLPPI